MKKHTRNTLLILLASCGIMASCKKESGSISGSWITEMKDQPQHQSGFTLKDEGTAVSINLGNSVYEKWEKFGDRLIMYGTRDDIKEKNKFSDTLKIVSVSDSVMIVKTAGGNQITYTKTANPEKIISAFETYDCYSYTTKKDTAFLHINTVNNIVTGDLEYHIFEKDSNKGTLKGEIIGDTLLADYTFLSEGTKSVRQIALLRRGNDFVEGFGESEEKDGKMIFTNRAKLNFKKGLLFKETNCH